jgi:hypothetical protein
MHEFDCRPVYLRFVVDNRDTGTVAFQHCSIFIFLYNLFLPEGQSGEVWRPSKNSAVAAIGEHWLESTLSFEENTLVC